MLRQARVGVAAAGPRAFSLLELVIVIAIIAALAAVALPRFARSLDRQHADAAARRIVADLALAQSRARATSAVRTVGFNPLVHQYTIVEELDLDGGADAYVVELGRAPYEATIVEAVFDDTTNPADDVRAIVFDGYGAPDSGGHVVISAGATTRRIDVDAETGAASIR